MKKHNWMKKLSAMILATAVAITGIAGTMMTTKGITAQAAAKEVSTQDGVANIREGNTSITILGNPKQSLVGKQFRVHRLFNTGTSRAGESINYYFVPEYEDIIKDVVAEVSGKDRSTLTEYAVIDYIQTLNHYVSDNAFYEQEQEGSYSDYRYFVEMLRDKIGSAGVQGTIVNVIDTTANNEVVLQNLIAGYYIIDEITAVDETYSAASLVMADTSSDTRINIKSDYAGVTKKILEDDGNVGWNDIGDFEIGQTISYKFESVIPDINGYKSYYYAWHDVMDSAIDFDGAIHITVYESETENAKSYELKQEEYTLQENVNDERFVVAIKDIKAIIDREFDNFNERNENVYGQKVVLTYFAKLNQNAAVGTGRPGFENSVRLEFSNDPDSTGSGKTGFTPWDTTVCYTYRVDVRKTNSHDLALEGAKFRLYSDEACKNEIYVRALPDGYVVINGTAYGDALAEQATEMQSGMDGAFIIYGLDSGTYYLKETEAPAGYRRLLDSIKITINSTFTEERNSYAKGTGDTDAVLKNLTATAYIKVFLNGEYVENTIDLTTNLDFGSANLTVINTEGKKLPATGSAMTLVCVGLGTAFVVYGITRKRKDQQCES